MDKIFISVKRELVNSPEITKIIRKWEKRGNVMVFAQEYSFKNGQEKEMMQKVKSKIASCDIFVAIGESSIGVGIEIGIAYVLGKRIHIAMEETSATLRGVLNN